MRRPRGPPVFLLARSGDLPEPGTLDALTGPFNTGLTLPACPDHVHLASCLDLPARTRCQVTFPGPPLGF